MTDVVKLSSAPNPCLSVVMPAYNEEATLATIVGKVLQVPQLLELILVDNCSADAPPQIGQTLAAAADVRIRYVREERNTGKTAAVKTGFAFTPGDIVIIQDADLEYDPAEIPDVISYYGRTY